MAQRSRSPTLRVLQWQDWMKCIQPLQLGRQPEPFSHSVACSNCAANCSCKTPGLHPDFPMISVSGLENRRHTLCHCESQTWKQQEKCQETVMITNLASLVRL